MVSESVIGAVTLRPKTGAFLAILHGAEALLLHGTAGGFPNINPRGFPIT
jgi:hypothetical protein